MPNNLCVAVSNNEATFKECRIFMFHRLGGSREKVINMENNPVEALLPYYIEFIETKNVVLMEAINFYAYEYPDKLFYELLIITVVAVFRKLEANDLNFIPY